MRDLKSNLLKSHHFIRTSLRLIFVAIKPEKKIRLVIISKVLLIGKFK